MTCWINVVSKDHLQWGIAGGFTQAVGIAKIGQI
jgi:hypothetical protein